MADEIRFVELPPKWVSSQNDKYEAIRRACRANPRKWAILVGSSGNGGTTTNINRQGRKAASVWYGFEATSRGKNQKRTIYVRYIGPRQDEVTA